VVMSGVERMKNYGVEFNTLTALNDYSVRFPVEIYRFLKKIGSRFHQYIPVVERKRISGSYPLEIIPPCYTGEAEITKWSVDPGMYGEFLKRVFDEWVKRDVGTYFVQLFDAVLANYAGVVPGLCIYAGACANPVLEYNGDVYSCDHFVFPEYRLGNIMERSLSELVVSRKNMEFGFAKRQSLPYECRSCRYTDICNGGCLRNRILRASEQGKNKNYLCSGLKEFYAHTEKRMRFMLKEIQNGRAPAGIMDAEI
ncbi:MAG: SPASM domain-containing protein, partial [Chitinivibrionales bacterium]